MTCRTCTHAAERVADWQRVLWCMRWRTVPTQVCADYEREPGSDD
jgi:hypothetical protein